MQKRIPEVERCVGTFQLVRRIRLHSSFLSCPLFAALFLHGVVIIVPLCT
jgi:hypothetical protein